MNEKKRKHMVSIFKKIKIQLWRERTQNNNIKQTVIKFSVV